jgi:RNA recognition motif-containing protein
MRSARPAPHRPEARLRVDNLPFAMTVRDLEVLFEQAGPVQKVEIVRHVETGFPCGFAFVVMASTAGTLQAIEHFNGLVHRGRVLSVQIDGLDSRSGAVRAPRSATR